MYNVYFTYNIPYTVNSSRYIMGSGIGRNNRLHSEVNILGDFFNDLVTTNQSHKKKRCKSP